MIYEQNGSWYFISNSTGTQYGPYNNFDEARMQMIQSQADGRI